MTKSVYFRDGDRPELIDLADYGGPIITSPQLIQLESGTCFRLWQGVYIIIEIVDELIKLFNNEYARNSTYDTWKHNGTLISNIIDIKLAIDRYYSHIRRVKLRGVMKSLVYLNKHYIDTMEIVYRPDGIGYNRLVENTLIGR